MKGMREIHKIHFQIVLSLSPEVLMALVPLNKDKPQTSQVGRPTANESCVMAQPIPFYVITCYNKEAFPVSYTRSNATTQKKPVYRKTSLVGNLTIPGIRLPWRPLSPISQHNCIKQNGVWSPWCLLQLSLIHI